MKHTLPALPYATNALEPYIDAKTMEIHHTKHHQAYVDKLNESLQDAAVQKEHPEILDMNVEQLLRENGAFLDRIKQKQQGDKTIDYGVFPWGAIEMYGGGHWNHSFFWTLMGPEKKIDEELMSFLKKEFGSVKNFKAEFSDLAKVVFGSGWAWLCTNEHGKAWLGSTKNQESPIQFGLTPLIGLDLWEHAYYLKYQNRRAEYIEAWWNVVKVIE